MHYTLSLGLPESKMRSVKKRVQDLRCLHLEIQFSVEKSHQKQKAQADKHRQPLEFYPGHLVKFSTEHLQIPGL